MANKSENNTLMLFNKIKSKLMFVADNIDRIKVEIKEFLTKQNKSEENNQQQNNVDINLIFLYTNEFNTDLEIKNLDVNKIPIFKSLSNDNYVVFINPTSNTAYIKTFNDKPQLNPKILVVDNIKEDIFINDYNTILKQIGKKVDINVSNVNTIDQFIKQLISILDNYLKNKSSELKEIEKFTNQKPNLPVLKGEQWKELLNIFKGLSVNLELQSIPNRRQFIDEKELPVSKSLNNISQIIVTSETFYKYYSKYGGKSETILFTKGKGKFLIQKFDETQNLEQILQQSIQIQDYENVNFQFVIMNFTQIFKYFEELIEKNSDEEIPDTMVEIFKDSKYKQLQLNILKDSMNQNGKVSIPIRIIGNKSSFSDGLSGGYILNFEISGISIDSLQENLYNLINKYYIGNLEFNINLKELGEEILDKLKSQGGVISQLTNQVIDAYNELQNLQGIFTTSQKQLTKLIKFAKQSTQKPYVTTSPENEPINQLKQKSKQKSQTQPEQTSPNLSPEDQEVLQMFSQEKTNVNQNKQNNTTSEQIFETIKKDIPFSKVLFDD